MLPGGAATLCSELIRVCAGTAPGHTGAHGTAVHSFHCLPGQTGAGRCLAGLADACVCLMSPHQSEVLAQQPNHRLGHPWWSVQDGVPAACSIALRVSTEPPQQCISRRKPDPGGMGETSLCVPNNN